MSHINLLCGGPIQLQLQFHLCLTSFECGGSNLNLEPAPDLYFGCTFWPLFGVHSSSGPIYVSPQLIVRGVNSESDSSSRSKFGLQLFELNLGSTLSQALVLSMSDINLLCGDPIQLQLQFHLCLTSSECGGSNLNLEPAPDLYFGCTFWPLFGVYSSSHPIYVSPQLIVRGVNSESDSSSRFIFELYMCFYSLLLVNFSFCYEVLF